jgi:citrate lyase subunit beta/citryl-CoA lyase
MLDAAVELDADELVFDLEDAVAPVAKERARAAVAATLARPHRARRLSVRINKAGGPWIADDLAALARAERPPDTVVVPKIESAAGLRWVADALGAADIQLQAVIESATGLRDLGEICAATDRLEAVVLGYADLCFSLDRPRSSIADFASWSHAQDHLVMHARAAGLHAVDGPLIALDDAAQLTAAATWARGRGFDGKWVIHHGHIAAVASAFTPTAEELAAAHQILRNLEEAERSMIDEALRRSALATIGRAPEAVAGRP